MTITQIFDEAVVLTLDQIKKKEFILQSEKDIQALVFHHAIILADKSNMFLDIHAEPTRIGKKPDLVLGQDEIFVEMKLSKYRAGGYTNALEKWLNDIDKLREYKKHYPNARCVFLAVDEAGYHSSPGLQNFFDPLLQNLNGNWSELTSEIKLLLAEI